MAAYEMKHTPGEWEITSISQDTGNIGIGHRDLRIVIAEVTNAASFADMLNGAMARGGGEFRQDDCHTQFANARLIAAAPELLAAAQAARALGRKIYHNANSHEAPQDWAAVAKLLDAAISKVEGR